MGLVDPKGYDNSPICQNHVKIPALCIEDEHPYDYPHVIGLALPITWTSTTSSVDNKEGKPLPYSPVLLWRDIETELLVLGLYIFGKNMNQLSSFLGKIVGDVISYYYGNFRKTDTYKRWAHCRKAKSKRCIRGKHIFKRPRLPKLISRLKSKIPNEAHGSLIEVFNSIRNGQTSFEKFVFTLKSIVGTEAFVEAVGIGKGKDDLARFVMDRSKPSKPALPTGKDYSSLALKDIIKFLTGDFRRSQIRSNEFFWEAVWPRLLAKGWHSEQPEDVRSTKNDCLVFLVPDIEKFCRSKLTKGTHYFDSVSEVLRKVAADPVLLELESDGIQNTFPAEKNVCITDMKLNEDSRLNEYQEFLKFTIIDTSLVEGEGLFKVRELRNIDGSNETMSIVKLTENKQYERKDDLVPESHSKIIIDETKFAKERAQVSVVSNSSMQETPDVDKASGSMRMKDNEGLSIPDCKTANDPSEETEQRSAIPQHEHTNPRRHGTRNRPPTAKALEAVAYGLLGGRRRKVDPNNTVSNRPSQRARKDSKF